MRQTDARCRPLIFENYLSQKHVKRDSFCTSHLPHRSTQVTAHGNIIKNKILLNPRRDVNKEIEIIMGVDKEEKKRMKKKKRSRSKKKREETEEEEEHEVVESNNDGETTTDVVGDNNKDDAGVDNEKDHQEIKTNDSNQGEGDQEQNDEDGDAGADNDGESKPKRKRKRKRKSKAASSETDKDNDENAPAKKLASLEHTVYVEGIPFDCTEDEVRDFFVSNGIDDILQLRLPRWQDSGRLRGYGHVVFESEASQAKAVKDLSGRNLKRRYLTIQQAKAPRPDTSMGVVSSSGTNKPRNQPEGCKTIFIKNLPYNATEEDIQDIFRQCGKILSDGGVRIARNYETRQSKGFAYVEYKNPEGAYGAVHKAAKGDMKVLGRPCFVDYDEGSMKGSFKTKDGRLWSREHKQSRGHNTDKRLRE